MTRPTNTSPRVLIAEDSLLIAMDLEDILKDHGCDVIGPVVSVKRALELLDHESIDVAIVDYLLEDGHSALLAKALNAKGIPFVLCTGSDDPDIASLFPYTQLLPKPYNADDVSRVVNNLIAARLARNP